MLLRTYVYKAVLISEYDILIEKYMMHQGLKKRC
jgi:hypothetical protein